MVMPAAPVSFPELFFKQVERRKDRVALRHKEYRHLETNLLEPVREAGAGSGCGPYRSGA